MTFYLLAVLACAPLVASALAKGWDWAWGERPRGILSTPVDHALTVVQALACLAFVLSGAPAALLAVSGLYAVMGLAVLWLRARRGRADCGCWGRSRSGRLGYPLGLVNLALAAFAGAVAYLAEAAPGLAYLAQTPPGLAARVLVFGAMAVVLFHAMVIMPVYRPVLREYRLRADRYRPWFQGFPDLRPAERDA
ncbi:hypothetical protein [Nonomuraea gerenzanensis]|uniref:Methylamine utilization protein MauE n=1 Tax=Nonomuraea gerenzanensis TaxID=93944 RepID=A0A1M4E5E2_9ACTN|nr:hypothetical protein [Nonomuraea gerenzanensis]UBU16245.1 hypothetical protein LCN96_14885 [Nonomuraea gerenzanensis]SBO94059.1 hypothetical protein BN4615_P3575 [Nonomuraea gerenzanensis]